MSEETSQPLEKVYQPGPIETRWWQAWEQAKIFSASEQADPEATFCVVIPPPNVTGMLHMGHALNNTLQDILIRFERMNGKSALWVFGMDHAGIATQNVVERQLKAEGKSRHDLGREAFIERVWKWKQESGGTIRHQLKKLGCSLDYEHERFTMDEGLSQAVKEVFIRLYEEGKIYRAQRLINWCPRCHTALSDLEVEHDEIHGQLWHIRYPLEANPQESIVVATTRPETLLGDTAVAVHPDDPRYQNHIGKKVSVPFVGRLIPIIADSMVDREFGSGAVKITPAHDFNDFEVGNRHNLERVNLLTEAGRMNENAGPFQGQDRFECRKNIEKELKELGLLVQVEDYKTSVGHCYRCKTVVEPYLSLQWFVRTQELAKPAIEAVQSQQTKIIPQQWENTYFNWMENIQDWCISRQIWWGHRIPVWYCGRCADGEVVDEGMIVSRNPIKVCPRCGHDELRQDSDVLDTWFSSALWPFSTLGWPESTTKLNSYYPTSTLITGFDIIFFWVARMMMMGLHFTGQVPFRHVYIHALVRDAEGQKMSKSKGNVIDPLAVMEQHGTDAFRFTLAAFAAQGRDIKLSEDRVLGYRNFCNKIWNAARLVLSSARPHADVSLLQNDSLAIEALKIQQDLSHWILLKLSQCISKVKGAVTDYRFNEAAMAAYHFFWGTYCDWFLELIKEALKSQDPAEQNKKQEYATVAMFVLDQSLRLLHPFMPFITEELWQSLTDRNQSLLAQSRYPTPLPKSMANQYQTPYERIELLTAIIEKIRQIRMETGVPLQQKLKVLALVENPKLLAPLEKMGSDLIDWVGLEDFQLTSDPQDLRIVQGMARGVTRFSGITVFVDLKGIVDLAKERQRQEKEKLKLQKGLLSTQKTLENPKFIQKAPPELVAEKKASLQNYQSKIQEVEKALELL